MKLNGVGVGVGEWIRLLRKAMQQTTHMLQRDACPTAGESDWATE